MKGQLGQRAGALQLWKIHNFSGGQNLYWSKNEVYWSSIGPVLTLYWTRSITRESKCIGRNWRCIGPVLPLYCSNLIARKWLFIAPVWSLQEVSRICTALAENSHAVLAQKWSPKRSMSGRPKLRQPLYVCVYVCVYVRICLPSYVCTYESMLVWMYVCICMSACMSPCLYVRMFLCLYVCTSVCMYVCMMCVCVYNYM